MTYRTKSFAGLTALLLALLVPSLAFGFSQTKTGSCNSGGCSDTITFTGLPSASSNVSVRVGLKGDFDYYTTSGTSEYADIYVDGNNVGRQCDGSSECSSQCPSTYYNDTYTVSSSYVSDGRLAVRIDTSSAVGFCTSEFSVRVSYTSGSGGNTAPTANAQSVSVTEDGSVFIRLSGSDADGDSLTYQVTSQPTNGSLSGTAPSLTYRPSANYNGSDSFRFRVYDGTVWSSTATVSITVTPVNDAPVARNQSIQTNEDQSKSLTLQATDVDGDPLNYTITTQPSHGTISGSPPSITYTPDKNYNGTDLIQFQASDGSVSSNVARVDITVNPVNDGPVPQDQTVTTKEDTAKMITLKATDPEGDSVTSYSIQSGPSNGQLMGTPPNVTYTPKTDYDGTDAFTFVASDGNDTSQNPGTVTVKITPVDDAPKFVAPTPMSTVTGKANKQVSFQVKAKDPEGANVTYAMSNKPMGAMFKASTRTFTWTPGKNQYGKHTVTAEASDGQNKGTHKITIDIAFKDQDGDGVPDDKEGGLGLNDGKKDSDGDDIMDGHELSSVTNPEDTDNDGAIDALDTDSDGDGVSDSAEAGDSDLSTPPVDTDGDGTADFRDTDSDGDGIKDGTDNCRVVKNQGQKDTDGDGKGDACDNDNDGDGIDDDKEKMVGLDPKDPDTDDDTISDGDEIDDLSMFTDTDGDGTPDYKDTDSDDDGIPDKKEAGDTDLQTPPVDTDGDGIADFRDDDSDNDGVKDGKDNCRIVANNGQKDGDGDGQGDACDGDNDGDGVETEKDNCPRVANPKQRDPDMDGKGNKCDSDDDDDGVGDESDNCPTDANKKQEDSDGDGKGDACDDDIDGDEVANMKDNCPRTSNAEQKDADMDGTGDACQDADGDKVPDTTDVCPMTKDKGQADRDADGVGDACDKCADQPGGGSEDGCPAGGGDAGMADGGPSNMGQGGDAGYEDVSEESSGLGDAGGCVCSNPGSRGLPVGSLALLLTGMTLLALRRRERR